MTNDERIHIETPTHSQSDWTVAKTRVRGAGPKALSIVPRAFQPVTVLGRYELSVGDSVFDRRFRTRGDDGFATVWIGSEVRQAVLPLGEVELAVYKGEARAMIRGAEHPPERVQALARAVELLATRGQRLTAAWEAAAASLAGTARTKNGWFPGEESVIEVAFRGRPLTIDGVLDRDPPHDLYTRVHCEMRSRRPPTVLDDETARRTIAALNAAHVSLEDGVSIHLRGFVTDPQELQAAMSLAITLAGEEPRRAPYR